MYNWGIRAIGVPNKSTKQTGDFWIYLIIYSMQVVIVSAWNPSQDPTGPLVVPHRKTGSPTSLGITFSHWHNSRKSDSNPKVKQHSLKYSQYTNLESVIFINLYSAFKRDNKISDKCPQYRTTKFYRYWPELWTSALYALPSVQHKPVKALKQPQFE